MGRLERIMNSAPTYYQFSKVYNAEQEVGGIEFDSVDAKNADLRKQLRIVTATWGLKYWESKLGITTVEADGYEIRRSRVLSKWRSLASQFSASLVRSICEAFSGGETAVTVDIPNSIVKITFIGVKGIPPNMDDLKAAVDNVIHAHLGTEYSFTYLRWAELDAAMLTWDQLDALGLTWDEFEVLKL